MKFFAVSDIHGYFNEFKKAIDEAGFDEKNPEHYLVVCGDCFDRGSQPVEVMNYLNTHDRVILIRGNHEDLLEECCKRGFAYSHDHSNGTFNTIGDFGVVDKGTTFNECCVTTMFKTEEFRNKMVDFFETKNYIFVHGWIPVKCNDGLPKHYTRARDFEYNPDWRSASKDEWEQARWFNGMRMASAGLIEQGKTIVCGHWHCSYGHHLKSVKTDNWISEFGEDAIFDPFYDDGIIAIDGCTAHTGKVNCVVIEDDFNE